MLDPVSYYQATSLSRQNLKSWRPIQVHHPHVFAGQGFPLRVDSLKELAMLVDTMQENRFDRYVDELSGIDDRECLALKDALVTFSKFFVSMFREGEVPLPLSTMIAHLALYLKISRYPRHNRILEIGPGCGYLSLFLQRQDDLEEYSQIESTDSFYLLQNLLNTFLFKERFMDVAEISMSTSNQSFLFTSVPQHDGLVEHNTVINYTPKRICWHFPWWEIGNVTGRVYDVITSNANLNEFSESAFLPIFN